jgi:hypothetical protein
MRRSVEALVLSGALMTAGLLGGASPAFATTAAPTLITSNFACSGSICEVGPGNVGMLFAAGLDGTGGPTYYGPECNPYIITVVSGGLPPGLKFGQPACEYTITGTPTRAGTYSFTVQITPQPDNLGQTGPSGTQQLSITIGSGSSDRMLVKAASYNGHLFRLFVQGYDVNISALYSVFLTSTGKLIIPARSNSGSLNGFLQLSAAVPDPCGTNNSCSLTVRDSLGSSATVTLPPAKY